MRIIKYIRNINQVQNIERDKNTAIYQSHNDAQGTQKCDEN